MARAKKTDRAEARRRHRAEAGAVDGVEAPLEGTAARAPSSRSSSPTYSTPAGRVGIGTAFRTAFHPLNMRDDIAALPWLLRSRAFLIPLAVTLVSTIIVTVSGGPTNIVAAFLFAYFVQTPPIGGALIAGFLAPRASWLLGLLVSLFAAACYGAVILILTAGMPDQAAALQSVPIEAFLLAPILGALFASGAAWYRRFLQLSNPNRGRRAEAKRGADGRSRSSGSQKAPVKR